MTIKNIQELFELAGSSTKLAAKLNIHAYTVENWKKRGVPLKYWHAISKAYGISPNELFEISRKINPRAVK